MNKIELEQEVTPDRIETYRSYPMYRQAEIYDKRTRLIDKSQKRTFVELGLIMVEMEDGKLFHEVADPEGKPFASLGRWISDAAPVSRSNAYAALNAMRAINEEVSVQDLQEMSRANVITIKKLSTATRKRPDIIAAAKNLEENQFIEKIQKEHPEEHLDKRSAMRLKPLEGDRDEIEEACHIAEWVWNVKGRESALALICNYFKVGLCELEQYQGMSNEQAFLAYREKA